MKSSTLSITFAAMMMVAAFAGIMLVADDVNADDGASGTVAKAGDYTVTFAFDGGVIVKQMDSENQFNFKSEDVASIEKTVKAPTGYMFSAWKDSSSGVVYDGSSPYTFTQDIVVEPVFKADRAIVQLTYVTADGETITIECMSDMSADKKTVTLDEDEKTDKKEITRSYSVSDNDLKKFADAIGAKVVENPAGTIAGFELDGYKFKGFVKATAMDVNPSNDFSKLTANATYVVKVSGDDPDYTYTAEFKSAEVVEYIAVFEPIYDVVFYIDDTAVSSIKNIDISIVGDNREISDSSKVPTAPTKENYIFMGWYDILGEKVIGYSVDTGKYTIVEGFEFTEDIALFAEFVPLTYTVTFVYGEDMEVFITETVKYGEKAIEPNGLPEGYKAWDFDFSQPITEDTVIVAIVAEPVTIYNVTFEIEGKAAVIQKSDSIVIPNPSVDGKVFKGWVVKGESNYVDPSSYDYTADVTFVAIYDKAPAPAGPGFFQTTAGQCTAVIIAVLIIALVYAVYSNMFGMKDFLTSFKVQRVKKE